MNMIHPQRSKCGMIALSLLICSMLGFGSIQASVPSDAEIRKKAIETVKDMLDSADVPKHFEDYCQEIITLLESIKNPEKELVKLIETLKSIKKQTNAAMIQVKLAFHKQFVKSEAEKHGIALSAYSPMRITLRLFALLGFKR